MLKAGVRFLAFDSVRNLFADEQGRLSSSRGLLAGSVAGCVESVIAVTPTERVKTALQVTSESLSSIMLTLSLGLTMQKARRDSEEVLTLLRQLFASKD